MVKTSQQGKHAIITREGQRLKAYQDTKGIWTIGVGHVAPWVKKGVTITETESRQLFTNDIRRFEKAVNDLVKVPLQQHEFDTLVSFSFNVGVYEFSRSTLLQELNKMNYSAVPQQLMRWNKITVNGRKKVDKGLVNRRASEVKQWLSVEGDLAEAKVVPDIPVGRSPIEIATTSRQAQAGIASAASGSMGLVTALQDINSLKYELDELLTTDAIAELIRLDIIMPIIMIAIGTFVFWRRWQDSRKGRAY